MEGMASPRFDPNNPALSFKKIRSSENINMQSYTSTSPLKSNSINSDFMANDRNTNNVLRETINNDLFNSKNISIHENYQHYDEKYGFIKQKNQFSSSHGSFKFNHFDKKYSQTPKYENSSHYLAQSYHTRTPNALTQNTSQNGIPNFFKKIDSKNQSDHLNNGIKNGFQSGKLLINYQKQNLNKKSLNVSRKQIEANDKWQQKKTSIQKTRRQQNKNVSDVDEPSKYRSKLYSAYNDTYNKENNGYDDYEYQQLQIRKDKTHSKMEGNYNTSPHRPPLYQQNKISKNKNLFDSVNLNIGNLKNQTMINLRQTVGCFSYGSSELAKLKSNDSSVNSKTNIGRQKEQQKQSLADTSPSSFSNTEGSLTNRNNKGHGRWISDFETKNKNAYSFRQNKDKIKNTNVEYQNKYNNSSLNVDNLNSSKQISQNKNFADTSPASFSFKAPKKIKQKKQENIIKNELDVFKLSQGQFCIQDFYLGQCKGQGRFGKVFPAKHKASGFICAIKKVKKQSLKYITDQFIQQVKLQFYMNHSNLVKLYGIFADKQHIYLLMEYMEGGSLYSLIKKDKKIPEKESAIKLLEIANGLQYMHNQSIVHRDIKPQNIVITHGVCKICDFGWAAFCSGRRNTYCGTLDYVSPEVLSGQEYDSGVDIWCYGVLAYELMVGKAPFYNISRKQTMKKIQQCQMSFPEQMSNEAKNFIQNILQKNPTRRLNIEQIISDKFLQKIKEF